MLKKIGIAFIILGALTFLTFVFLPDTDKGISLFAIIALMAVLTFFLGISFVAISSEYSRRKKYKNILLSISIGLLLLCLFSFYTKLIGATLEGLMAVLCYCFAYAPLELNLKSIKWKQYTSNPFEIVLLSTLDFAGINLILIGILSKILHWPGQFYLIYTGIGIMLIGLILWNYRFKLEVVKRKDAEDKIKMQYLQIEQEKKIADELLLNILPEAVADELKAKGSAKARLYEEVTVLFTDFKDFTKLSEKMTPTELVEEIHSCFKAFDEIVEQFGIEKIKTIGDSYMCAGGLPVANATHAIDVVNAAIAIRQCINQRASDHMKQGKEPFQIRIGIHTGPVVAGIVGIKKFAYDIWGDTVNTASRMESSGEAGKINISETTYELIKHQFICTPRGKIQAKGKGEMEMYFVEGSMQ